MGQDLLQAADRVLSAATDAATRLGQAVCAQDRDALADLVRRHAILVAAAEVSPAR